MTGYKFVSKMELPALERQPPADAFLRGMGNLPREVRRQQSINMPGC